MDKPGEPATFISGGGSNSGPPPGTRRFKTADITSKRVRKPELVRNKSLFAVDFVLGQSSPTKPLVPPASASPATGPPAASTLSTPPPPTTALNPATVPPGTPTPTPHTPKLTAHPPSLPHPRLPALPRWPASLRPSLMASSPSAPAASSPSAAPAHAPATAAPAATSLILPPAPRTPLHPSARPEVPTLPEASAPPLLSTRAPAAYDRVPTVRAPMPPAQGPPFSPLVAVLAPAPASPKPAPPALPPTSSITPPPLTPAPAPIGPTVQPLAPAPANPPMPSSLSTPSPPAVEANSSASHEERQAKANSGKVTFTPAGAAAGMSSCPPPRSDDDSAVVVEKTTKSTAISGVVGPAVAAPPERDVKRPAEVAERPSAATPVVVSDSTATDPKSSNKAAGAELPPKQGASREQAAAKPEVAPPTTTTLQADVEVAAVSPSPAPAAVTKSQASTTHEPPAPVSPSVHSIPRDTDSTATNGTHAAAAAATTTAESKLGPSATESDAVGGLAQVAATSVAAAATASPTGSPTRKRRILTTKWAKVLAQEKAAAKREADLQDLRDKRRALNSTAAVVGSAAAPSTKKETPASRRLSMLERLDSEKEAREREERKREELEREERRKAREERLGKAARAAKEARARARAAQERAKDTNERREAPEQKNEKAKAKEEEEKKMEREPKEKEKEEGRTDKREERANGREERNDDNLKEEEEAKEKEKKEKKAKKARNASVQKETARERERASKREAKEQAKREREAKKQAKREREAKKQARRQQQQKSKQPAAVAAKKDEPKVVEAEKAAVVAPAANEEDEVDESLTSSTVQGGTMMLAAPIMGRDSQQPPGGRGGLSSLPLGSTLSQSSTSSTSMTPSAFKTYSRPTNPPPFTLILPRVNLPQSPPPPPPATATVQQPSVVIVADSKPPVPSASYSMVPIDAPLAGGTIERKAVGNATALPPSAAATVAATVAVAPKRRGRPRKSSAEPTAEPPVKRKRSVGRPRKSASAGPTTPAAEKSSDARGTKRRRADSQGRGLQSASDDSRSATPVTITSPASTPPHSWPLSPATSSSAAPSLSTKSKPRAARASGRQVQQAAAAGPQTSAEVVVVSDDQKEGKSEKEPAKKRRKKESGDEQKKKRKRETKRGTDPKEEEEEEEEGANGDDGEGVPTNEKREGAQTSGRRNRTNPKSLHKRRRLTAEGDDKPAPRSLTAGKKTRRGRASASAGIDTPSSPSPSSSRPASPAIQAKSAGGRQREDQFPELEKMLDGFTTLLDSTAGSAQGAAARKSLSPAELTLPPLPRPSIPMGGLEEGFEGFLATCTNYFDAKQQRAEALASPLPPPLQSPHQAGPLSPPAAGATTVPPLSEATVPTVAPTHDAPAPTVIVPPAANDPQSATTDQPTTTDERTTETHPEPQFFHGMDGGREGEEGSPPELGMQLGANLSSSDSGGVRSHLVSPFSDILREFNIDAGSDGAYKQPHQQSHHSYAHQQQPHQQQQQHANYFGLPTSPLDMFMVHPHEQDPFAELSGGGYAPFLTFPADDVSPYYSPSPLPDSGEKTPGLGAAGGDLGAKSGDGSGLPLLVTNLDAVDVVLASGKTYSHNISDARRAATPTPTLDVQSFNVTGNGRLTPTSAAAPTPPQFVSYSGQRLPTATPPFRATTPSGAQSSPHDGTNGLQTQSGSGSTYAASPHPRHGHANKTPPTIAGSSAVESDGGEHRIRFYVQLRKGNETVPIRVNKGLTFRGLKKLGMEHWGVKGMSPKLFRVYDRHGAFTVGRDLVVNEAVSNECFTLVQLSDDSATGDSTGDDSTATRP